MQGLQQQHLSTTHAASVYTETAHDNRLVTSAYMYTVCTVHNTNTTAAFTAVMPLETVFTISQSLMFFFMYLLKSFDSLVLYIKKICLA